MTDLRTPSLRGCFCCGPSDPSLTTGRRGFMLGAGALALTSGGGWRPCIGTEAPTQNRSGSTFIIICRRRPM